MKKRLILIPLLVLALIISMGMPVLAWDEEDPCVAANEDFIWGVGWDGSSAESYYGEQSWSYYPTPSDGYNLYRDDVTDTGNLDEINDLITRTPDAIEGLSIEWAFPELDGGFWYMGAASPDTWYWATEPRGYDNPEPVEPVFVRSPNAFDVFVRFGYDSTWYFPNDTLAGSIEVAGEYNDSRYMLEVPAGCVVEGATGRINWLWLDSIGDDALSFVGGDASFSEPCTLYIAEGGRLYQDYWTGDWLGEGEWVEVGSFTSIVDGEALLD